MNRNANYYRRRLQRLEQIRKDIASRIDNSYLRDNISDFLSLEHQYRRVIDAMNAVRAQMSSQQTVAR